MDKHLASHAIDEGVNHIGIGDVGELIVLLREALDVLPEGLVGPLPAVVEVPQFSGRVYVPWKCPTKTERRSP
jgi:hypothetical protein